MVDVERANELPSEILTALLPAKGDDWGARKRFADAMGVRAQTVTKWMKGEVELPRWRWLDAEQALTMPPLTFARRTGLQDELPADILMLDDIALRRVWSQLFKPAGRSDALGADASVTIAVELDGQRQPGLAGDGDAVLQRQGLAELDRLLDAARATVARLEDLRQRYQHVLDEMLIERTVSSRVHSSAPSTAFRAEADVGR